MFSNNERITIDIIINAITISRKGPEVVKVNIESLIILFYVENISFFVYCAF